MNRGDDWETHWRHFAVTAQRNPAQRMRHATVIRLLRGSGADDAARILDLGSGQGDLLALLQDEFPAAGLAGFELSRSGVELAQRKAPAAQVLAVDLFQPTRECDAFIGWATHAVCVEVLEHVDDPQSFLRAAARYCAPGSRLIVTVPGGPMSAFDRHIGHRRHFNRRDLLDLLSDSQWSVESVRADGFPFFNLYRLLVIARGRRMIQDAITNGDARPAFSMRVGSKVFSGLFRLNISAVPLGWQMIALARRRN